MLYSFFKNLTKQKHNGPTVLLVDIGSSSVGVALACVSRNQPPHILASVREEVPFQGALSSRHLLFAMNQALHTSLSKLTVTRAFISAGSPSHIFCTMSSPWFILKTRNIHVARQEEFEVSERTINEFIDSDIALLKETLSTTLPIQDIRVIEKKIMQMKLNGVVAGSLCEKKNSRMDLIVSIGISSQKVIHSIEKEIHKFFHIEEIHFGAFPVSAFSTIRDMFSIEKNFLFMDITGEATDVSRVENDILMNTVSFPYGKNLFIREISTQLFTVHEEAATLFSMFLRDELPDEQRARVAKVVMSAEKKWLARFEEVLANLAKKELLPSKIFFTVDTDIKPLFQKLITQAKTDFLKGDRFDVQYLDQLIVSSFVSFEAGVTRDPFIVVEALLSEKIIGQDA